MGENLYRKATMGLGPERRVCVVSPGNCSPVWPKLTVHEVGCALE